eukprot:gene6530-biopygen5543
MDRLRASRLLVTNDTGGMHLANALGVPLVALFGPTNPIRTGPVFNSPARILQPPGCPPTGGASLHDLAPATVIAAVQEILAPPTSHQTVFPTATLGIVGESGSGKSVTCYSIMGLIPQPPGRIVSGTAMFDGVDLLHCTPRQARSIRGKRVAMIFQDPMTSLNPYMRISEQLIEPLLIHEKISKADALKRALAALESVGINDAVRRIHLYPHEFSGGMRQRVMIAMALITKPELLIADEPPTALD